MTLKDELIFMWDDLFMRGCIILIVMVIVVSILSIFFATEIISYFGWL